MSAPAAAGVRTVELSRQAVGGIMYEPRVPHYGLAANNTYS
ncbi:hypothetical protein [Paraburkholderia caribensis]|nr:hypothetical protein [Paraburkholderia caribensis]